MPCALDAAQTMPYFAELCFAEPSSPRDSRTFMPISVIPGYAAGEPSLDVPLPIRPHAAVALTPEETKALDEMATSLAKTEHALTRSDWFGPLVKSGIGAGPWVVLSDHREIPLASEEYSRLYEYRLAMLAREGDRVVLSTERHEDFEEYRSSRLGLGAITAVTVGAAPSVSPQNLAKRCLGDQVAFERLRELASTSDEVTLMPYIGSGHNWLLARQLALESAKPVHVAAPQPALTRRVNDKAWFAQIIERVLGSEALPPAINVSSAAAMAARVRQLASVSERIVVKIPDSAGSVGNLVFRSDTFRQRSLREIRDILLAHLGELGWSQRYPLVVQTWETNALSSPSAQIWVPRHGDGMPIVAGVFEQITEGERGKFVGSTASHLPKSVTARLIHESTLLAALLQVLGYFGPMSLDCIVADDGHGGHQVHWIECNGRWGGVSIPMTLVNRLTGDWHRHPFVVAQRNNIDLPSRRFVDVLELLSDLLFPRDGDLSGVVLLGPQVFESGCGYQLVSIAHEEAEARALADQAVTRLAGRRSPP